jgi:peptidoglycan hydrolase-like protein with peptidoglycan-binding domain
MTILAMTFLVGLALIIVAIFGGGLEIKEVKIPTLPTVPRALSFVAGTVLIVLCLFFPHFFSSLGPAILDKPAPTTVTDKPKPQRFRGAAIENGLISVQQVKIILRRLKLFTGPIDDEATDGYFQAVGEFQISQNIPADGLVGPITYAKLREAWPEFFAGK